MKKLLLLFAAVLMASTGLWAETQNVSYLYPVYNTDGVPTSGIKEWKTASVDATVVENASEQVTWNAGWYVVTGTDVTLSQGAICSGNVRLILADGAKLTATGIDDVLNSTPGIQVSGDGNSLTIYGQTAQTGILKATGKTYSAGIGGNGADGLRDGSNITINGGTVTANGGSQAAAIGGGLRGNGSNIIINGGTVTAKGSAAGIGGGNRGNGTNIIINGGTVTARGGDGSDGIGNGANATTPSSNIFVATTRTVRAGSSLNPTTAIANNGDDLASALAGKQNVMVLPPFPYIDENGEEQAASASEVTSSETPVTLGEAGKTTWYVITGTDVTLSKGAICAGNVNLILADGAKLTATTEEYGLAGIQVFGEGNSLAIYGQTAQSGQLIASGGDYGAGIGGRNGCYGSHITINGGTVTATGGYRAAGIGGGFHGSGSNITINGGTVTANGGENAAGIGSGCGAGGSAYNITFNGGTVKATGGEGAVAIGTGQDAGHSQFIFASHLSIVKAGNSENPTTEIASEHTSTTDIASDLADKKYVTIELRKIVVVYGDNITVSPTFTSGAEITARTQITFTAADRSADGYDFSGFFEDSTFNTPITTGVNGLTYTTPVNAPIFVYAKYDCHQSNSASYIYPVYNDPEDITKGVEKWETETSDAFVINPSATSVTLGEAGKNTWYVVTGTDVQLTSGAICYGNVNLILADGAKLTATGEYGLAGIQVSGEGNSLTIYGQKNRSGQLIAQGGSQAAGIGGGTSGAGSNIIINGVTVTANGRDGAAGIGGGTSGAGSNIIINGGTVTARGDENAAGIGGGYESNGSNITINGGEVIANSNNGGAGIGGGYCGSGSYITINGGKVTSNSEGRGAGIGGGFKGCGSDITINGGTVTAIGGRSGGDGIGSGLTGLASVNIFVAKTHFVKAGDTEETIYIVYNPSEDFTSGLVGKRFATIEPISAPEEPKEVTYIDENGEEQKVEAEVVLTRPVPVTLGEPGKTTWYVVTYADEQLVSPVCQGDVRLILADGAKLTATGTDYSLDSTPGIQVSGDGNSLTIYCQNAQSGRFVTYGGTHGVGIGGGHRGDGSSITINGGTVNAHGGDAGAGIGGGWNGSGSNITINGGTVNAYGGNNGAGIGGGFGGSCSNITINGGTVNAYGGDNGAGIGGGFGGSCSNITINGGTVNAYGGDSGAGIGGGFGGSCSNITIKGDMVTANGGENAAGIGGGNGSSGSYITINGGTVTANGKGVYAAGIGGGYGGNGSNITINGGMVTANGGRYCAGIGCGFNSSDASNIFVATNLILKADGNNPPTTVIENNGGDLAESLAGKQYVTVTEPTSYKVQATSADESKGSVSGGGIYVAGTEVTLTATSAENYVFEKWSDGMTANPYVFTATKDVTITALFTEVSRYITDGTEYTAAESKFLPEVIYTRTFDNTNWQALYVPFSIDYEEWSEKFDIAKIRNFIEYDDDDNGTVDRTYLVAIKKASGSTEPNYPYLIRAKEAGTYSLVLKDKTLEAAKTTSIDCRSVENEYTFTGTYTKITDMYANGYYALAGGVLCKAESAGVALNPQRWYMEVTSRTGSSSTKAQSIQILVDGEEGIESLTDSRRDEGAVVYDLQGRAVGTTTKYQRGINIVNGKKIIK